MHHRLTDMSVRFAHLGGPFLLDCQGEFAGGFLKRSSISRHATSLPQADVARRRVARQRRLAATHYRWPLLVVTELKLTFTLELVLQGIDRVTCCDEVWLAVRASSKGRGRESDGRVGKLCRMLGFGLLDVRAGVQNQQEKS